MPPHPVWFTGHESLIALTSQVNDPGSPWHLGRWRSVATRANRQPAVAHYVQYPDAQGGRRRFAPGDVLCLQGLTLRRLRNPGREPAVLVGVARGVRG